MTYKVLVTARSFMRYPGPHIDVLREADCELRESPYDRPLTAAEMVELVKDVDAIIAGVDEINAEVLAAAPRLKVVSRHGVGYDSVDVEAATKAGVVVTITPGANHVTVAELAIGFMIALARHLPKMIEVARSGGWQVVRGIDLAGKTVGIVGLGRIGKALATRVRALEMDVLAYDVVQDTEFARQHGITYVSLEELLRRSDFVCLHAAATPGAPPLIGEAQLRLMKPSAYLINVARGSLIDEQALYRALTEGWLAGAALDVFAKEPPGDNPLLKLENVIPTPHIGGATREAQSRMALMAAQNALQVLRGERCPYAVNPEVYAVKSP